MRLQPYVLEAVILRTIVCNPMCQRLQPYVSRCAIAAGAYYAKATGYGEISYNGIQVPAALI